MGKEFNSVLKEIMEASGKPESVLDAPGADTLAKADVDKKATNPENDSKSKESSKRNILNDKETKVEEEEDEMKDDEEEEDTDLEDYFTDDEEEEDGDDTAGEDDEEEEGEAVSEEEEDEPDDADDEEEEDEPDDADDMEEEEDEADDEEEEDDVDEVDESLIANSLNSLFDGAENLNEEFVNKAKTVTETYLRAATKQIHEKVHAKLSESFNKKLAKNVKNIQSDLVMKLDKYLDYVVEEWMEQNTLAVENGIRQEIAEGFMNKLYKVFKESYVDVPESKIDLVEELSARCENLKEHNQNAIRTSIKYKSLYENEKKANIVRDITEGLSDNKKAKLSKLAESISYENLDEFSEKLKTLRESINVKKTARADDNFDYERKEMIIEEKEENNSEMSQILKTIDRLGKSAKK